MHRATTWQVSESNYCSAFGGVKIRVTKRARPKCNIPLILHSFLCARIEGDRETIDDRPECVELLLLVKLRAIRVCLQTTCRAVASLDVDGFTASMTLRKSNTRVELTLSSVTVADLNPETMYNKVNIRPINHLPPSITMLMPPRKKTPPAHLRAVSCFQVVYIAEGNDALKMKMCFHNHDGTESSKDFDTLIQVEMSSLQCVFINAFLMDVLVRKSGSDTYLVARRQTEAAVTRIAVFS